MARLSAIFDTQPDIRDTEATDRSVTAIAGRVEFRNVTFRHRGSERTVLQNIDLIVEPGTTLAVIGPTGAGKSTLVNLLPRLYDVTSGQLLIDGLDVRTIPLDILRTHIGYVPQETFLFSDTISQNIRFGAFNAPEEELLKAADISQISKDVNDFPNEYGTMVGERGITLSGGQKQRTSIARAVITNPSILILDDALSSVDTHTEEEILRRMRVFMKGRTSIIISHRISTVKDADMIVVLEDGTIVERGTHEDLVALNGRYASLYRKQLLEKELVEL